MRFAVIRGRPISDWPRSRLHALPVSAFAQAPRQRPPAPAAAAAGNTGVPNALQGFSQNKDQPIQIEAQQLDVRDKDKVAIFTGNVVVTQGDTIMKCKTLHVFYDQDESEGRAPARAR